MSGSLGSATAALLAAVTDEGAPGAETAEDTYEECDDANGGEERRHEDSSGGGGSRLGSQGEGGGVQPQRQGQEGDEWATADERLVPLPSVTGTPGAGGPEVGARGAAWCAVLMVICHLDLLLWGLGWDGRGKSNEPEIGTWLSCCASMGNTWGLLHVRMAAVLCTFAVHPTAHPCRTHVLARIQI